jgi:hypothetical protein
VVVSVGSGFGIVVVLGVGGEGCGSGAVMVGGAAAGTFGFFFLHADESITVEASRITAIMRSIFIDGCSSSICIPVYSIPRRVPAPLFETRAPATPSKEALI